MQQIVPPIHLIQTILGEQKANTSVFYRVSTHSMCVDRSEGLLLYSTLTGELLLLSREEAALLGSLPGPVPPALSALVARWFLNPMGMDDMALADQTREIAERLRKRETIRNHYTIFTTTACNARCFYCFETGWKQRTMAEQTAHDAARYIAAHCGGKPVRIQWFGGEPLVNIRAIDVISDDLCRAGVAFRSSMTSNGYLFDEALTRRARDDWNLKSVQITLDGTEEVYNQRKAYVNPEGSPYRRVLRNIGLLLDAGIEVHVRLNMDADNERELYALLDELEERFAGSTGITVYLMVLQENAGMKPTTYTDEERRSFAQNALNMRDYAGRKGFAARVPIKRKFAANACSADSDKATTITPEGRLGRCEACMDDSVWGSIYSDEADTEMLRRWKERKPPEAACETCAIYPQCVRLKRCPGWPEHCSFIERTTREHRLFRAIQGAYEDWRAADRH